MMPSRLLVLLAALLPFALGQSTTRQDDSGSSSSSDLAELASELPTCGLECVEAGLGNSTCTSTACMCSDQALLAYVTVCVMQNCTVRNQLVVKNVTNTACGVPVRDSGAEYNILSIVLGCISAAVLVLRLGYKWFVARVALGWDDWFIVATVLVGVPNDILISEGAIPNGLGRDIWTLTPREITNFGYFFYHMMWNYFLNLAVLKMSLLFFYLKIFPNRTVRWLLWGTMVFNAVWGAAFVLLAIFQCQPISYYWVKWDGEHTGTCLGVNELGWANAVISIVEDFWMLAIPLSQLRSLQLHLKKKIGVAIMFCTGTFVTVISIIRLQALVTFANSSNPTWDNLRISQWSTIEINIGIICACMPTLRLMLLRIFPSLSSTTRAAYYGSNASFGGDRYLNNKNASSSSKVHNRASRSMSRSALESLGSQPGSKDSGLQSGIRYQRSYAVHFQDAEASSQVRLADLEPKGYRLSEAFAIITEDDSSRSKTQQHASSVL